MKTEKEQITVMVDVLTDYFGVDNDDALPMAGKMIQFINNKASTWISTINELPEPQLLSEVGNTYYHVRVEDFGEQRAMYLMDQTGECGWYLNYIAKVCRPVTHYQPEFKLS